MADNNPYDFKTNSFVKRMVKDIDANYQGVDTWSHARNLMVSTHDGEMMTLTNEPSNVLCYEFNDTPLSKIPLQNSRFLIIQKNGEFGVLDSRSCTYEKLFVTNCPDIYNFTCKPILGSSKIINNTEEYVVFGNEDIPIGELNLSKIPYKYTIDDNNCKTKKYIKEIDCKELFQFKEVTTPCLTLKVNNNKTGNLPNGSYRVAIAFLSGGQKSTDYFSLSQPIFIYNERNLQGSIEVNVSNLDRNYSQYQLLLISNSTYTGTENSAVNNESYFNYGPFDTLQTSVTISDISNLRESLDRVMLQTKFPVKVGNIVNNADHLFFNDIIYNEPINYQLQAMDIKINYVIKQVSLEYYKTNYDFGYYGDENYSPAIQWITNKGEKSERYHIPGRVKEGRDRRIATGDNVYELDQNLSICDRPESLEVWQTENTSGNILLQNNKFSCNERILGTGEMGYYESDELYPDNKQLFGKDACTNIRYPKFPDECKVPRYCIENGVIYINLKLWQFSNIEHPKDKNGKYRTDIQGYQILRQSRGNGNKTIISTGMMSNTRGLVDAGRQVYYQNYPFNDYSSDSFHSLTEVNRKNNKEQNFNPLTEVFEDRFSYYTPDALYGLKTSIGSELKVYTEEKADVVGSFEPVFRHPKSKLLTNFSYYLASLLGLVQTYLEMHGKSCSTKADIKETTTVTSGTPPTAAAITVLGGRTLYEKCDTIYNLGTSLKEDIANSKLSALQIKERKVIRVLQKIIKIQGFTMLAMQHTNTWLDIIENLVPARNYAYQYNAKGSFQESKCVNKRVYINNYQYINESNTLIKNDIIFNNEKCNKTIYIETNKKIPRTTYNDNSNITPDEANICNNINSKINTSASMYYAATKIINKNQYGKLDTGEYVKVHSCTIRAIFDKEVPFYTSPVLAGGDCIIAQTNFQTRRPLFNIDITNENTDSSNYVINYKAHSNLAYTRYWYNSEPFDTFDIINKAPSVGKLPSQRHNFTCSKNNKNAFGIKDEYMITSVNAVIEYIVEADANLWFRQNGKAPHYSDINKNLSNIFRSDRLNETEEFILNPSYFILENKNYFSRQQDLNFDISKVQFRDKNAIIYSLPGDKFQSVNNWRSFLPNNYYSFDNMQFGNLTGVHSLDMDRLIFLFDKSSPFISLGRSELETTSGDIITLGDGGLFARKPREIVHTDVGYGNCQSSNAFCSTQFGHFYPSAFQGRFFKFTESLEDLSRLGIHYWSKAFMPFKLKEYFPNYNIEENTICGIGYNIIFDNTYSTVYLCKKDYKPLDTNIIYNNITNKFLLNDIEISLTDTSYFENVSWTLSYRPENEGFVSFHDWHPDQVIQTENHFMAVYKNAIYKHNENCQSFCNFQGVDYPFEVTLTVTYGQQQQIFNSFEYLLEVYRWKERCIDRYHVLDENFNKAIVYNTEQNSGILNLLTRTSVNDNDLYNFPRVVNNFTTDIICSKKENRYRFNSFKDIVKDRGELSRNDNYLFKHSENGYTKDLYESNFNANKDLVRFRHSLHNIWLCKDVSKNNQFIFKFLNSKLDQTLR